MRLPSFLNKVFAIGVILASPPPGPRQALSFSYLKCPHLFFFLYLPFLFSSAGSPCFFLCAEAIKPLRHARCVNSYLSRPTPSEGISLPLSALSESHAPSFSLWRRDLFSPFCQVLPRAREPGLSPTEGVFLSTRHEYRFVFFEFPSRGHNGPPLTREPSPPLPPMEPFKDPP